MNLNVNLFNNKYQGKKLSESENKNAKNRYSFEKVLNDEIKPIVNDNMSNSKKYKHMASLGKQSIKDRNCFIDEKILHKLPAKNKKLVTDLLETLDFDFIKEKTKKKKKRNFDKKYFDKVKLNI